MSKFLLTFFALSSLSCYCRLVSCIYEMRSMRIYTASDLAGSGEDLSLPGQLLSLVSEDGDRLYLGGWNGVYELSTSNLSRFVKVAAWPGPATRSSLVRSVYFPGNSSSSAFVCAVVGRTGGGGVSGSRTCLQFDRAGSKWSLPAKRPAVSRQISDLLLPPSPTSTVASPLRPPVSLRRAIDGSRVVFAALPPIRDSTDLVELTGPAFADIGFTTCDLFSRRSRPLWMARGAGAFVMHEAGQRLYTVYTEAATETSNYVDSVNSPERPGLIKMPIFTRLSRVCLNDPGQIEVNRTRPRVLTSFFKLRLICRHNGTDYDVLELATEVSAGQFIGLFAPQNSPPAGFRALCRFRLADAEALLTAETGSDFIEVQQPSWQSPRQASRVSREEFRRRSDVSSPFNCVWTEADAKKNRLSDLKVARMAALLASPMVAEALTVLPPRTATGRRATALTLLAESTSVGAVPDQLLVGWDSGEITRLSVEAARAVSPAVETLQALPLGQAIESVLVRSRRLIAIGPDGASSLPLTRCGRADSCSECGLLGDPLCLWTGVSDVSIDGGGSCTDREALRTDPAAVAAATARTKACAAVINATDSRLRGLPLAQPQARSQTPRQLSSSLSDADGATSAAGLRTAGVGVGAFLGALAGASCLAFLIGVALGVGCIGSCSALPQPRRRQGGKSAAEASTHARQQPISSVSTASTSSDSTSHRGGHRQRRGSRRSGGESGQKSSPLSRILLKGIECRRPPPTHDASVPKDVDDDERHRLNSKVTGEPLMPTSNGRARCRDNEYVQAADLVPASGTDSAAEANRNGSRCSSWESCFGDNAPSAAVVNISEPEQQQQQQQQQQRRHQVTVNAGIIGHLSLSVGFKEQPSS